MTNEETINLLKTLSETIDKLASFNGKRGGKEEGDTIVNEDDKLSSTLSSTEKRRWETMSKILAKTIKDVVFPKGEEKVGRPEFKQKEVKDLVLSPTFAKIKDASNKWLGMILAALALLGGVIAGVIAEISRLLKGLKLFLSETKLGKFIKNIFTTLKAKLLDLLKPIRESKIGKFFEKFFSEKIIKPLSKFFQTIGRIFGILEAGKGPLLMMKSFPTFFKIFEEYIRIAFKAFQIGIKLGRGIVRYLGPVGLAISAIIELVTGFYQAFTDPKLKDKSFIQKLITGLTQGILNFFDFFEIFGLDLFNFDTIRDRIEAIFKPFREGKWIEGLGQIFNQIVSLIISIPGKIIGWIVGWFNKDLGNKTSQFFDKFDLFKFFGAIFKRLGKVFEWMKGIFGYVSDKLGSFLSPLLKLLGGPVYFAFQMLKKAFEYAVPLIKGIGSMVSKVFGYIKNFFVTIWNGIKWVAKKIGDVLSNIPGMGTLSNELKAIAAESQVSETTTPISTATNTPAIDDFTGQENIASTNFEDILSTQEDNTTEAFSMFGDQVESLNKTGSVNNKIAVDQLREFKTLNQKFDMLIEQLMNNKNIVTNVVNQNSVNSFPQSTSVFDLRNAHRGGY